MLGKFKQYIREQIYWLTVDPEKIRENNPLVKVIDDYVEEHISNDIFVAKLHNQFTGSKAINPKMMLKVLFYCFASGIYTSRSIEKRMANDLNTIYLSGNTVIDHSNICRFINKYQDEIMSIFSKMVYILGKSGFISYELEAIDGTKIRASANKRFTGNAKEFRNKKKKIEEKILKILQETTNSNTDEQYSKRVLNKLKDFEQQKSEIDKFLNSVENGDIDENESVNLTDKDAKLMKMNDGSISTGYNCQAAVDSKNEFIAGAFVTDRANDRQNTIPMIEEVKRHQGEPNENTKFTLDAGYFTSDNIQYGKNIDLYIPEGKEEDGSLKRITRKDRVISKDCELIIEDDLRKIKCPGGQIISSTGRFYNNHGDKSYRFNPNKDYCRNCNLISSCADKRGNISKKRFDVNYKYFETVELRREMLEKLKSVEGKRTYNERACLIEHVFGTIKEYYRFGRFYYRGLDKVNTIWHMVCIAYNFRKMASIGINLLQKSSLPV
jgi:transposase